MKRVLFVDIFLSIFLISPLKQDFYPIQRLRPYANVCNLGKRWSKK